MAQSLGKGIGQLIQQQAAATKATAGANPAAVLAKPDTNAAVKMQASGEIQKKLQGVISEAVQAGHKTPGAKVKLILNQVKSPMLANTMGANIGSKLSQAGITVETKLIGKDISSDSPLGSMMSQQMMVMPLMMLSLIISLFSVIILWMPAAKADREQKLRAAVKQLGFSLFASLLVAVLVYGIVVWFGGVNVGARAICYLWFASLCIMLVNIGLCDLFLPIGALLMLTVFALGLSTAVIPVEMLPAFWADWVAPWAPQFHIGQALRNIIFADAGAFSTGVAPILIWGAVGVVALVVALLLPRRTAAKVETK